jgi:sodium transport system permease protein
MRPALIVARKELRDHLRDYRSLLLSCLLALMGPVVVSLVSLSDRVNGENGGAVVLGMLSVFALVTAFSGGAEIAMDATAGERERRSLLPLLLNPIPRSELTLGKWIAVTIFTLAALALNSAGLVAVLAWVKPVMLVARAPQLAVWVGLGLIPLAMLGAAVNLFFAARCRTTKEAHAALQGLVFVPMFGGMFLVFFPHGIGSAWWVVPIAGQQALVGLPGQAMPFLRATVLAIVTLAAAIPALIGVNQVLNRDDLLSE